MDRVQHGLEVGDRVEARDLGPLRVADLDVRGPPAEARLADLGRVVQADYFADAVGRYSRAIICAYRDQHLGKLASPDDYCVVYAMRALAFWRARGALPEPDRDAALFGVACLCAAGRDVAFAVAHASKAKVDDWLGADVVDSILRAAASRRVAVPEAAKAEAKVPFGGIRARDAA